MSTATNKTDKETLSQVERWLEGIVIVLMWGLFGFFMAHQQQDTGFFTSAFGEWEKVALYAPIFIAMMAPIMRATTGQRNPGRLWDAAAKLSLSVGSLWLLATFPFDYSHLADVLPGNLHFVLFWITDGIARIILLFQVIIGPFGAIKGTWDYFRIRERESQEGYTHKAA